MEKKEDRINLEDLTPEDLTPTGDFKPGWFYNEAGDQIEAYWKKAPARAERFNDEIDLYRDRETNEIVGVCIKGVKKRFEDSQFEEKFKWAIRTCTKCSKRKPMITYIKGKPVCHECFAKYILDKEKEYEETSKNDKA